MRYQFLFVLGLVLSLSGAVLPHPEGPIAQRGDDRDRSTGSKVTGQEALTLVQMHNDARSEVGVGGVTWSNELAAYAQEWADHLAAANQFDHRPDGRYGENLAAGSSAQQAVGLWLAEKERYHGEAISPQNFSAFGHYTQMVWRDTREIGCGKAKARNFTIWVCNYDPGGNMLGEKPY